MEKRIFDFLVALVAIVCLLPLYALIAVMVHIKLGSPILFRQQRPGFKAKPFIMYKFRSMTDERDEDGKLLPDQLRFNRFSYLLRQSSMDELPELFNVLKGDMSLVGPRPLLMQYLDRYNREQARRHDVKPGITGWAQVNGRNALTWKEKFEMDVWYVDHQRFWLDLKIIGMTLNQVFKRHGVQQEGHVTAEEFMGNRDGE